MRRAADPSGFTLVELVVGMLMTTVLMGAMVALFTSFIDDNRFNTLRDESISNAQTAIERISRELRTAKSPSVGAATVANAGAYDLDFMSVSATGSAPSGNATNEIWIRYCLDGNLTLWRQTTAPASTTSTLPDTSACPSTSASWVQVSAKPCCQVLNDVTNRVGGNTTRPLFTYGPTGYSGNAQIKSVETDAYVDKQPGLLPGATQLTSGVFLRNDLASPTASFAASKTVVGGGTDSITLDGSSAFDPQGQVLTYQWYTGAACATAISGATGQKYTTTATSTTTYGLIVTDTAGLASPCTTQQVTVP